jgi:hypothetical protein
MLRVLKVDTIPHWRSSPFSSSGTSSNVASALYTPSVGVWKLTRARLSPDIRNVWR